MLYDGRWSLCESIFYWQDHSDSLTLSVKVCSACVLVFAGELYKEMTVDYERAASEERLDEVGTSECELALTNHS